MKLKQTKRLVPLYTVTCALLGILFVTIVLITDMLLHGYTISIESLVRIHNENPILYLIDLSPIPFVITAYLIAIFITKNSRKMNSVLDTELEKSKRTFGFIEKLRLGETDTQLQLLDEYDELGRSLINLRDELKRSKQEDAERKKQDEQRVWITEGLARFGAILRENIGDLDKLSSEITSNLVKYMDAKQAAFFILKEDNESQQFFDMKACFAFGRKKFPDKRIHWGEGLIGACALEKNTIFIKEVTDNYVEITSGLGKANPRCLLIVPLKINEEIHGVIELSSFKIYEAFEIEFVEKVAESIASTISNVKINMRTAQLLKESQEQAIILARQEEEMRKNMNELKQTQIEAAKQSEQFVSFTNSVNHTMIRAEYTVQGILSYANTKFLNKLGYTAASEVEGKHISMFINEKDRDWFSRLWENLAAGGSHFEGDMKHVTKQGTDVWTMATYVNVRDHEGKPQKILFLGIDVTEAKKQNLDYKGQIDALNRSTIKAEYASDAKILEYNQKFLDTLNYTIDNIKAKTIFDFIQGEEQEEFKVIWQNILRGVPYEGRHKRISRTGEEKWFHGTYTVVHDMYGEPAKVVYIGTEITEQIRIETKNKEQTEILREQEQKLQQSKIELSRKLKETREEMKLQFREIETVKMLNEKTLEGMLDAIITIDQDNKIEFFNRAAEELWGLQREEVLGKQIELILSPEFSGKGDNYMGNYFKASDFALLSKRTEVYIIDKFGEKVSVLLTLSEARIGRRFSLTAFIQRIEIELF